MNKREDTFQGMVTDILQPKIDAYSSGDQYVEEPHVDIETFVKDSEFLNWGTHIYPGVMEDLKNTFIFDQNGDMKYNQVVLIHSPGTGKSIYSAISSLYMIYRGVNYRSPQKFYGLAPGQRLQFMNCSSSGAQAKKVVFDYCSGFINDCKWFRKKGYIPNPAITSELQFPKGLYITPGSSTGSAVLGTNLVFAIFDELSDFLKTRERDTAQELYDKFIARAKGRLVWNKYLFISISAPKYNDDFIEKKFTELTLNDKAYTKRRTHWDAKPKSYSGKRYELKVDGIPELKDKVLSIPVELKEDFDTNVHLALRTWASLPSRVIAPYFKNIEALIEALDKSKTDIIPEVFGSKGELLPLSPREAFDKLPSSFRGDPSQVYYAFSDLAKGVDCKVGFGLVHKGKDEIITRTDAKGIRRKENIPTVIVDLVTRFSARAGTEIDFDDVKEFICRLKNERDFNIKTVGTDSWQSVYFRSTMTKLGFNTESLSIDGDISVYQTLLSAINTRRLKGYYRESLFLELCGIEEYRGKAIITRGYKDQADGLCGAVCLAIRDSFLPITGDKSRVGRVGINPTTGPGVASRTTITGGITGGGMTNGPRVAS